GRSAARAGHSVKIDIMRHLARWMIGESKLHQIALANADETSRNITTESPEQVVHAIGHALDDFAHLKLDDDLRGVPALYRRRHVGSLSQHRHFFADGVG